jgi:hypothetical protein
MENILHSVYLKHNSSFKSLTKQALAQIILKIIFQNGDKGIFTQKVRGKLKELTGVNFDTKDINEAIARLEKVESKINSKAGRHFIKPEYKATISQAVSQSEKLHKNVIDYWFGKSETYNSPGGAAILQDWFENLLVDFFKDYSYDWIRDLKPNKGNGKKKTPNIENIIEASLYKHKIIPADHIWLKMQFKAFIESNRVEDNEVLWAYGSSMFSATLLTARNFADEFSLEVFKDSDIILDTNILMILELEAYEKNYALDLIETTFEKLNISPKYFRVSRDEYLRAIGPKRDTTLAAVQQYDFDVIKESDCPFVQTAIKRQCVSLEDFEEFFNQIGDIPSYFYDSLELQCEEYQALQEAIEAGEGDEKIKNDLNTIYKRRTTKDKREKPKTHDAGLYKGVEFLNKSKKTMILTRDSILREYAYENAKRDELPFAIGFDSLIQMMAINSGGTDFNSTDFAPLFSRLVKEALTPEKETFKPVDLDFILKTRIQISELPKDQVIKIAKEVNRLRLKEVPEEDIVLEIQRLFQVNITGLNEEIEGLKTDRFNREEETKRNVEEIKSLENELINEKFKGGLKELKGQVFRNRLKLLGMFIVVGLIVYSTLTFGTNQDELIKLLLSFLISIAASFTLMIIFFNDKLWIKAKDKEDLLKKAKKDILSLRQPKNISQAKIPV